MSTCNSCGGVVGKDCFNPQECAWITQQMAADQQHQSEQITKLQTENKRLTEELRKWSELAQIAALKQKGCP